jgi:hypothetical protein
VVAIGTIMAFTTLRFSANQGAMSAERGAPVPSSQYTTVVSP